MNYTYESHELYHHGILGQKWGVRRFQNEDGTLTEAGKRKYRTGSVGGNIGRALTNTTLGQRLIGVGLNRGYRQDRKEIKSLYKDKKRELESVGASKEELKSLKEDYRKTKGEARVSAAEALYGWQSTATNEKIQTQGLGKQYLKSVLAGGTGAMFYDNLTGSGVDKRVSAAVGFVGGMADYSLSGALSVGSYIGGKYIQTDREKEKARGR